jgi:hypothetical protein
MRYLVLLSAPWLACAHGPREVGWVKPPTPAGVTARSYEYSVGSQSYTGYLAFPTALGSSAAGPGTLLAHQWYGLGEMEMYRCEQVRHRLAFAQRLCR